MSLLAAAGTGTRAGCDRALGAGAARHPHLHARHARGPADMGTKCRWPSSTPRRPGGRCA